MNAAIPEDRIATRKNAMTPFNFLRRTCAFSLAGALMLHSAFSVADDTEIFFGTEPGEGIKPNVLFILDDSGSMNSCTRQNWRGDCLATRMSDLQLTMNNLLNTTSGINVGLMVLNNSAGSTGDASVPRLLQPVSNIDSPISVKISSPEIKISADDASRYSGSNNIADPTLVMGYINNPGNVATPNTVVRNLGSTSDYSNNNSTYYERGSNTCSVKMETNPECPDGKISSLNVGSGSGGRNALLLFRNLNIPKGVTITNAVLQLDSSANATSFNVSLASSKTPEALNHGSPQSNVFPANTSVSSTKSSSTHSLDITSLLKAQQNLAPTLNPIGDLLVRLRARDFSTLNIAVGDVANAPQLTITYTGSESSVRTTGLRFQTVNVPQGATITRATLNFVPASSDDRNVSFAVAAEASDNASDFSGADFSYRPTTVATNWTPAPWRTENPPTVTDSGADVTEQVQTVVNRAGWCGNNAMAFIIKPNGGTGSRTAISQDGHNTLKPVLSISYTGGDTGCSRPIVNLSLIDEKDDARQYRTTGKKGSNTTVNVSQSTLAFTSSDSQYTYIGARYQKVPFKKGATVNDVRLYVTPNSNSGTTATANVYFHDVDNSPAFNTNDNNLGERAATTKASCTFESQGPGIPVFCDAPNLKNALQSVLNRSGWSDGNSLSVLIEQSSSSSLSLQAFESNRNAAISLQVTLDKASDLTDSAYKVRDYMKGLVDNMNANGMTPLVGLLSQAASYYTALPGKHRGPASPFESSCQANYLVLMSDGQANDNTSEIVSNAQSLIGSTCTARGSQGRNDTAAGETCGVEIARWLRNTDQSSTLDGDNTVITHTVGFALSDNASAKKFLADVATAGGGKAYTADDASALASAFSSIIQEALASDTTFVSATAPVNSFNRQDHKDQLYFSLFRPSNTDRWPGNLKRYRMGIQNGSPLVLDADGSAAIDANSGFFRSSARSWWSSGNDGSNVVLGGAANQLPSPTSRNLWTNINGDTTLNRIETLTEAQTKFGTNHSDWINYIRGYESGTTTARNAIGDPIHSTPSVVTYECTGTVDSYGNCSNEKQSVIVGTNEGFVQMFDTNTGAEQFAFMPKDLLSNIGRLAANANMNPSHVYGMDNSVTVWANDKDKNGAIDGSDFVYAYATMGRGGRNIYALDITNPTAPKLKWQIQGGSGDFSRLGQTWSAPVKAKVKVGATVRDVLIFAGGYDTNQDKKPAPANVRRIDGMGNDLFIVDAESGARLWSASAAGIDMKYSVPSRVSVIGLETDDAGKAVVNKEGLVTQIFVGDMGGQVWRFLINNGSSGNGLATGKVFASIASDTAATARRFYHEPAIALINANNKVNLTVSIGSGYRGHPLDKIIQDRFYSFRTEDLNALGATLTEGDLYDASSLTKDNTVGQQALLNKSGWYINLAANGEKVLSSTMVIGGELYFNTYQPVTAQDACRANTGVSRGYRVNLLDGTAVNSYRYSILKGSTLPSNPQLYCKGDTCWAYNDPSQLAPQSPNPPTCTGPDCPMPPEGYDMASKARLYWTDKTED